jgi:hypothetical protein
MDVKSDLRNIQEVFMVLEKNLSNPVSDRFLAQVTNIPQDKIQEVISNTSKLYPILETRGVAGTLMYQLEGKKKEIVERVRRSSYNYNTPKKVLNALWKSDVPMTIAELAQKTNSANATIRRFLIVTTNSNVTQDFIKAANKNGNKYKPAQFIYANRGKTPDELLVLFNKIPHKERYSIYSTRSSDKINKTDTTPLPADVQIQQLNAYGETIPKPKKNIRLAEGSVYPGIYKNTDVEPGEHPKPTQMKISEFVEESGISADAGVVDFIEQPGGDSSNAVNIAILKSLFDKNGDDIIIDSLKFKLGGLKFTVESN